MKQSKEGKYLRKKLLWMCCCCFKSCFCISKTTYIQIKYANECFPNKYESNGKIVAENERWLFLSADISVINHYMIEIKQYRVRF